MGSYSQGLNIFGNSVNGTGAFSDPNYVPPQIPLTWSGPGGNSFLPASNAVSSWDNSSTIPSLSTTNNSPLVSSPSQQVNNILTGTPQNTGASPTIQKIAPAGTSSNSITDWINSHAANWTIVGVGIVLGLGALLISQKQTAIQIVSKLGE